MSDAPPLIPDFKLLRPIGRGAYGEVWLARSVTGVHRAVKIVRRGSFGDDRPFEREFAGLQRFEPVSVGQESQVSLLHVGRNEAEGFFYYVMELADDVETVEEVFPERYVPKTLKELRARRSRLPAAECLDIGLALTRALAHLHDHGLVHRDIKPSNVIFVHGVPKLADIGLVSAINTSHSFVGTEGFVPREGPGTAAADIYSLGKVLYEISTGRDRNDFPNLPEDLETLADRRTLLELNEVVVKACDPNLARRYKTAAAMREDLLLVQAGRSVRRLHLVERRVRFIAKFGVAAGVIATLAIAGLLWASSQTREVKKNFMRAERAEAEARARLHEANFNWARANRLTGRPGQRFDSLSELAKISARTNRLDLRNEAIACLALADVRPLKQWAKTPLWDSFSFSHDFQLYGTNDEAGNVFIRDTTSDELRYTLPTQGAFVNGAASSRDGRFVATSDNSGRAWLWTLGTPTPRALPFGPEARLLDFTADGSALAVQLAEDRMQFINVTNGVAEPVLTGLASVRSLRISPDGQHLLFAKAHTIQIRHRDGTLLRSIPLPENVSALAWHPDGRRFVAAWLKHIGLWEADSGRQRGLFVGHETLIVGLAFDAAGEQLASASWDRTTRLWQTDTAREVLTLNVSGNNLRLSPDGRRLAFKSWDNSRVYLYERADTRMARRFSVPSSQFTAQAVFSPDGQWIVAVDDIAPHLYHSSTPLPVASLPVAGTATVAFEPDGKALYTCGGRGLRRWPLHWSDDGAELQIGPRETVVPTYLKSIQYFCFSGDGRWCVTALKQGGPFFAFDKDHSGQVIQAGADIQPSAFLLDVNHDGSLAASWSDRRPHQVQFWNPQTGNLVTNLESTAAPRHATISPDNRWLAMSSAGETTLWTLSDWQPRHRITHPDAEENRRSLAFSPDNRTLAVVVSDREVWLIDVNTGAMLAALPVDRLTAALAFSPGGDLLSVTSERGWFQLWDLYLLREQLAAMNLDWPAPPLPSNPATTKPPRVTVALQSSAPPTPSVDDGGAR